MSDEFDCTKLKACGVDVRISPRAVIRYPELVSVGSHVAIDDFVVITTAMEIGDYVHISPHCTIIGGRHGLAVLKHFAGLSAGCRLICGSDDYLGSGLTNPMVPEPYRANVKFEPIVMEKHSLCGTSVVVHPGIHFGEGAVVGSCSLVTKSLEPWTVNVGVPARRVKPREQGRILELEARLREEVRDGR